LFVEEGRIWSVLRTFDLYGRLYPDLSVWANSLAGPPDLSGNVIEFW